MTHFRFRTQGLLCVVLLVAVFGCGGGNSLPPEDQTSVVPEDDSIDAIEEMELPDASSDDSAERPRRQVSLYFPSADTEGLEVVKIEIYDTPAPEDVARQILGGLLADSPPVGRARAVPDGTRLRQVYLYRRVAWVNFSREFQSGLGGGSSAELSAVYAVVNSVALNLKEIDRVGILIDGQPIQTLNGHLDLSRPLAPDLRRVQSRV